MQLDPDVMDHLSSGPVEDIKMKRSKPNWCCSVGVVCGEGGVCRIDCGLCFFTGSPSPRQPYHSTLDRHSEVSNAIQNIWDFLSLHQVFRKKISFIET